MKPEEIQVEWDAFIEYPEGSGKLYVTTTSALIFARSIVEMAEKRERDKLRTQNQALVKDANRYQWLRSRVPGGTYRIMGVIYSEGGSGVDAAIDSAIAQAEGGV